MLIGMALLVLAVRLLGCLLVLGTGFGIVLGGLAGCGGKVGISIGGAEG